MQEILNKKKYKAFIHLVYNPHYVTQTSWYDIKLYMVVRLHSWNFMESTVFVFKSLLPR